MAWKKYTTVIDDDIYKRLCEESAKTEIPAAALVRRALKTLLGMNPPTDLKKPKNR